MTVARAGSIKPGNGKQTNNSLARPFTVQLGPDVPPVRHSPSALARRFHQLCVTMVADSLAEAGLTSLHYGALSYLNNHDGEPGMEQNGLAARLGVDRSHVTLLVKELSVMGLIERRLDGADMRIRRLHLTSKGESLRRRLLPGNDVANDRILEPLSPRERERFVDMLIRILKANGAHARPGADRRKRGARHAAASRNRVSSFRKS